MTASDTQASPRRRLPWGLLSAVLAYAIGRGLVIHTAFDEVSPWMYELSPMGTLAELLRRGVAIPPHFFYDNAGGQVLAGYLSIPAFALLGPSYLALKVVPFLLGLATLLLVHAFLLDAVDRRAAVLGAWFVALAPTTFFKYSIVCSGNHPENVFFSMLVLVLFFRLHRREITARVLFAFGAACGLALFNSLGALVLLGILACVHAGLRGLRRGARDVPACLTGFLIGASPLLVLNAMTRGRGLSFLEAKFGEATSGLARGPVEVLARAGQFLFARAAEAPCYPDLAWIRGTSLGWIFTIGSVAACLACAPAALRGARTLLAGIRRTPDLVQRRESATLVPVLFHLPISALAFGLSNLVVRDVGRESLAFIAYRYLLPCFLCVLIAAAAAAARAWTRGGLFRVGAVLLAASVLLPGLSNLALVDWSFSHTGLGSAYEGYDLSRIGRSLVSPRVGLTREEILAYLDRLSPAARARVLRGVGFNLAVVQLTRGRRAPTASLELAAIPDRYPPSDRPEIARGAGAALRFQATIAGSTPAALLEEIVRNEPAFGDLSPRFLEGVSLPTLNLPLAQNTASALAIDAGLVAGSPEPRLAEGLAQGQGLLCGMLLSRGIAGDRRSVEAALQELPAELHASFFRGVGAGCTEGADGGGLPAGLEIPPAQRASFWAGFAERLIEVHGARARQRASEVSAGLPDADRALLERALSD